MKSSLLKRVALGTTTLAMLTTSFSVIANPPHYPNAYRGGNLWWVDAYDDDRTAHNWVEDGLICFDRPVNAGTHYSYDWVGFLPLRWPLTLTRGLARQEGDQFFMRGDRMRSDIRSSNESLQWEIVSYIEGYGHWQTWYIPDNPQVANLGWTNIKLRRWSQMICNCGRLEQNLANLSERNEEALKKFISVSPDCAWVYEDSIKSAK